jgi:phage terminase small subunit
VDTPAPTKPRKIPPKQLLFVEEFLKDFNGTQAAIRAGFSEHTAAEIAYEYLRKPQIHDLIEQRSRDEAGHV